MFRSCWLAIRPKTLTAAIVPIAVGSSLAYLENQNVSWIVVIFATLATLFIQMATNLFNDAIDFSKGADNENRLGPRRATQSGLLSLRQVYFLAFLFAFFALLCGVPLVLRGGGVIVVIGVVSLFLAYAYTGGPWPLAYKGLGDIFVILFFGIIAVGGVYYLHSLQWSVASLVAGLQVGFLATVLIAINNLRDIREDARANKKTLAVRYGVQFARLEIVLLLAASFILGAFWVYEGVYLAAILPLVLWPQARALIKQVLSSPPSPLYNKFLGQAALIHLVFGIQLSIGLLLTWN